MNIKNWYDLYNVRNNLSGDYILDNSLTTQTPGYYYIMSVLGWDAIGSVSAPFTGSFDGKGHQIHGLKIHKPFNDNVGLFGVVSGTLSKINLRDVDVVGKDNTGAICGMLLGDGNIFYSCAVGSVVGATATGGVVGHLYGSLKHSYFIGSVHNNISNYVGGLVGRVRTGGEIDFTYTVASVTSTGTHGALCGHEETIGLVENSYWNSDVFGAVSSNDIGTPLTTVEMRDETNVYFADWDFVDAWSRSAAAQLTSGDFWKISKAGTVNGVSYSEGNWIVYTDGDFSKQTTGSIFDRLILDRRLQFVSDLATNYTILGALNNIISISTDDLLSPPGSGICELQVNEATQLRTFNDCACDTANRLRDGDVVKVRVLDNLGVLVSELMVVAREARGIVDTSRADKILIKAELFAHSATWQDGNISLTVGSDPNNLQLGLVLVYSDDTTETVMVDGVTCFQYGIAAMRTIIEYIGYTFPFLVKLFLPNGLHSPIAEQHGSERFVAVRGSVVIVA